MPESAGYNVELAHHLSEHSHPTARRFDILEVAEALVLAAVAIATAWTGYQAALWTGKQSELYGVSSKLRFQSEGAKTAADQERLYNASTAVEWLKAEARGEEKLAQLFEQRFLPEFLPTFQAWKQTDPLHN